jgi:hypothetical protein
VSAPHSTYWATCPDCDARVRELVAEGLSNGDAQGVAEAEHLKARKAQLLPTICTECGHSVVMHRESCSRRPGQRPLDLT